MQSNWKNFNAYYNTYYNAEKNYEAGLEKNLSQMRDYNPLQPVRIHPVPVNAGAEDFDKAIQKAADILRRHDDTKWVDDAIFLIGKSYYFRQEYFSADQKFRELYVNSEDPQMRQRAIIWQGRALLEMELHSEGVAFLYERIEQFEDQWKPEQIAEAKALLAQHHVEMENWQLAAKFLSEALRDLQKTEYRERGYFLLGQIYERSEDLEAAYNAYSKVSDHFSEYRIQYLAQRKRAEVARSLDRNDLALNIFESMVRDDKNLEYRSELDFELARTEHELQNYRQAEKLYNDVLHSDLSRPTAEITARAYYGLAEIYRFGYENFSKAAAYYDSAAQQNVLPDRLPEDFEAELLAESFGNYARIKSEIALRDSLLKLAQLSPDEFELVLKELREQKIQELEAIRSQEQQELDQMVTVNQVENNSGIESSDNGFLNINNRQRRQNLRQQFYAVWGNRPLADNWRVRSMIRSSAYNEEVEEISTAEEELEIFDIEIDLSDIPFSTEEQDSVRKRIAAYNYELGNLFFLSLNMPDSAIHYFQKAIATPSSENINMVSLYSLAELYAVEGIELKAIEYAEELLEKYPNSVYSSRVAEQFDLQLNSGKVLSGVSPLEVYRQIMQDDSLQNTIKAERLKQLSYNFNNHPVAPKALYEALEAYTEAGKSDSLYSRKISDWMQIKQDTSLIESQMLEDLSLKDSTWDEQNISTSFPYVGASWDSARVVADTFLVMYPGSELHPGVILLKQELEMPESLNEGVETSQPTESDTVVSEGYLDCEDIGEELNVRGGLQQFLDGIDLTNTEIVTEIIYRFKVNQRGIIEEYILQTENADEEIKNKLEQGFERNLSFEAVLYQGQAVSMECNYTFPVGS
ncbi:MAG TPA: tetratricopeptide repeat protein [Gracilimonas sp.]|uniref:type IX secretion system periplasmic lipoprotein PorW/SprE n=1 Tax=Gracilimonas sp. TaxID=1974203 RepID=UPI002D9BF2CD|nr:tetratricopeptide repeat protein [Gracilimonas sp.]